MAGEPYCLHSSGGHAQQERHSAGVSYTNTCGRVRGYPSTGVSVAVSVQFQCFSCIGEWDIQSMTPMLMVSPSLEVAHINMSGHTVKYAEYT